MTTFDPYYKWLAIPPDQRPINHYDLLGLRQFESDIDVIINAAEQRMVHVKSFSNGPLAADSQRILNELSQAKVCLANQDSKSAYDATLRQSTTSQPVAVPTQPKAARPQPVVTPAKPNPFETPAAAPEINVGQNRRSSKGSSAAVFAFLAFGILALLSLPLAWYLFSATPPTPTPIVSASPNRPAPVTPDPTPVEAVSTNANNNSNDAPDPNTNSDQNSTTREPIVDNVGPNSSTNSTPGGTRERNGTNTPPNRESPGRRNTNANLRPTNDNATLTPIRKPPRQNPAGEVDRTPISDQPAMEVLPPVAENDGDTTPPGEDPEADLPLPPGLINELDSGLTAIFEHRYPNYLSHVNYSRRIAFQSRQKKAIEEVRFLESFYNAYTVVWDEVQTAIKSFEAGNQIKIGKAVASVVEAKPQELVLFANTTHKQYLGRRTGSSIVFHQMPKPLIMHLARLPGSKSPRVTRSLAFIDSVSPDELPKDPKDRWDQIKMLWEKTGNGDKSLATPKAATTDPRDVRPTISQAQLITGEKNVLTNRFDFDNTEDKLIELTDLDASTKRLRVVNINLGRSLGKLEVPDKLTYLEVGKPWRLNGDRDIPVTLRLSLKNDGVPTITASATYRMIMSRSKKDYPLHLPEVRKRISTVEGAIKKHQRKATLYQNQIKRLQEQIAAVARTRVPRTGAGALAAAQQKQMTLAGLNEQKNKKQITLNSVAKQIQRSEEQRDSYKSILKFGQEMQSDGWIQVKVIPK